MLLDWRRLVERATRWFLRNRRPPLDISATVAYFSEGVSELTRRLPEFMLDGDREGLERATEQLVEANVPPELARRVALLNAMFSELDIVDIATGTDEPLDEVAAVYFTLGDRLKLHWLRGHVEALLATTAGRRSPERRCATTSIASRPSSPRRYCAAPPPSSPPRNVSKPGRRRTGRRWIAPCRCSRT